MDIAEIRKKAKAGQQPLAGSPPVPTETPPATFALTGPEESGEADRPAATAQDLALAASGLDRLFSETGARHLVTEDAYETSLAASAGIDDAGFMQCLAFKLGPEEYALDITRISEIIKLREYTDIPRAPECILGLISLRGVVVPVIDLRRRFKLGDGQVGSEARIVVCRAGEVAAGLLVDSITQVFRLAVDLIEPPPAVLSGIDRSLVNGVGRHQGRMIILLNLATVLDVAME